MRTHALNWINLVEIDNLKRADQREIVEQVYSPSTRVFLRVDGLPQMAILNVPLESNPSIEFADDAIEIRAGRSDGTAVELTAHLRVFNEMKTEEAFDVVRFFIKKIQHWHTGLLEIMGSIPGEGKFISRLDKPVRGITLPASYRRIQVVTPDGFKFSDIEAEYQTTVNDRAMTIMNGDTILYFATDTGILAWNLTVGVRRFHELGKTDAIVYTGNERLLAVINGKILWFDAEIENSIEIVGVPDSITTVIFSGGIVTIQTKSGDVFSKSLAGIQRVSDPWMMAREVDGAIDKQNLRMIGTSGRGGLLAHQVSASGEINLRRYIGMILYDL
jgi:hypothetical protein